MMENFDEIKTSFNKLKQWDEKYKYIIGLGKKLDKLPEEKKEEKFLVKGCQSQVWLVAEPKIINGSKLVVQFIGESDSLIVQGLLSILLSIYSNKSPDEILNIDESQLKDLDLEKHLSPNRANGVFAMVKQIKYYAQAFKLLEKQQN